MADSDDVETVERFIPAAPPAIFDLLADPSKHSEIDGSGTVRGAKGGSTRLALGSRFGMSMKWGMPYSMVSEVVEFEENRRIAWQTKPPVSFLEPVVGGRIWRYELEPSGEGTIVRESWDISQERVKAAVRPMRGRTRRSMEATLARIEAVLTA